MDEVYLNSTVLIAPILAGSGLKIKIVEAMRHGRAVVSTQNGVEGLINLGDCPCVVTHDWKDFGDAVIELILNDASRHKLEKLSLEYSSKYYSIITMEKTLSSLFHD